jgi:ATP-dependent RNA helicase DDX5/DBP2
MMMRRLPRLRLFSVGVRCQATAKVLQGGWEQWADDDGTPYYHHRASGKTQWHYPMEQDEKPRPPAPGFGRHAEPAKFARRDDLWERKPQSNAYGDWEDLAPVEHKDLPPIEKFRCGTHPDVLARSDAEQEAYLKENSVTCSAKVSPLRSFEEAWSEEVAGAQGHRFLTKLRKKFGEDGEPSVIQSLAWGVALTGRDMIGVAQTGCGKTLAFMLPALLQIEAQEHIREGLPSPQLLVLSPTRELCTQIEEEAKYFTSSIVAVYGGVKKDYQVRSLQQGRRVVVATPGRLLDLIKSGEMNLRNVTCLVLDEADRMLDMGFEPQIRQVVGQIRKDRQTLFFSATWPQEIRRLARDLAKEDPVLVQVGNTELQVNPLIEQRVEVIEEKDKMQALRDLIDEIGQERILVFTETKRKADALCQELRGDKVSAWAIHGDKTQDQRDTALRLFKEQKTRVLVATDVAQRGLDIKEVNYVLNYDKPKNIEDYTHRIGRTGRAGRQGTAITFMTPVPSTENVRIARDIAKAMRSVNQEPPRQLLNLR